MPLKPNEQAFVACLRIAFTAESDVVAAVVADNCARNASRDLDDDDTVVVTTVENLFSESFTPEEAAVKLESARNIMLRLQDKDSFEIARWLDQFAWGLRHGGETAGYDYGHIFDVAKELYNLGRRK